MFSIYTSADALLYSSTLYLPDIEQPEIDRKTNLSQFESLDGSVLVYGLQRPAKNDSRIPSTFDLEFDLVDNQLATLLQYIYGKQLTVKLDYPQRWQQLTVTKKTGATVTVAPGYIHYDNDTFWVLNATDYTTSNGHTKFYITMNLSTKAVSFGSGISLPTNSVQLATIAVSGGSVTISGTTGYANMRKVKFLECQSILKPRNLTGFKVKCQEVF